MCTFAPQISMNMQESKSIIEVNGVSKFFGEKTALDHVTLNVKKGEFVTILGPSGCGKTTLLRLIAGFQTASEGEIKISGKEITQTPPHKRPVNTVFQKYALFPHLNVYDNIAFGLKLKKMPKQTIEKKVKAALKMVGMTDYEYRDVDSLSGGQQQRVAIARAIIDRPKVLLLDESLSALDMKLRKDMQYELRELQQSLGITFIFVTHDQEEALAMSDWVFIMNEGEIVQSGTPTDIYDEPINHFVADFIGESNILNGRMIEDYLVEFNGQKFEAVDGGMRKNEPIEVVIRPEDIWFTLPDEGKFNVKVDTQLFRGVHYEIVAYDEFNNEWLIHSTHKAIVGETVGLDFDPEAIHIMRLNETEEEFDARIEEYVEEEETVGLANAVEEENAEEEAAIQEAVKEALENTMELTELAETVNEILQKQENEPESENKESGANK